METCNNDPSSFFRLINLFNRLLVSKSINKPQDLSFQLQRRHMINPLPYSNIIPDLPSKSSKILILNNLYLFDIGRFSLFTVLFIIFLLLFLHNNLFTNIFALFFLLRSFVPTLLLFLLYFLLCRFYFTFTLCYVVLLLCFVYLWGLVGSSHYLLLFEFYDYIAGYFALSNLLVQLLHPLYMGWFLLLYPKIANFLFLVYNFAPIFLQHVLIHFFMNFNQMR